MTLTWHGAARPEEVVNLGPLALIQPLLDQLDIAGIIDRHLPPDPQLEFSHGQVLSLLLAARLCQWPVCNAAMRISHRTPSAVRSTVSLANAGRHASSVGS
jgi:hypothetical protein